jgi:hypothetical protein
MLEIATDNTHAINFFRSEVPAHIRSCNFNDTSSA